MKFVLLSLSRSTFNVLKIHFVVFVSTVIFVCKEKCSTLFDIYLWNGFWLIFSTLYSSLHITTTTFCSSSVFVPLELYANVPSKILKGHLPFSRGYCNNFRGGFFLSWKLRFLEGFHAIGGFLSSPPNFLIKSIDSSYLLSTWCLHLFNNRYDLILSTTPGSSIKISSAGLLSIKNPNDKMLLGHV